jgi:hypothetical protein
LGMMTGNEREVFIDPIVEGTELQGNGAGIGPMFQESCD